MQIWQKLTLTFGSTSILLILITLFTIKIDKVIQSQTNETVHGIVREAQAAGDMFTSIQSLQALNRQFLQAAQSGVLSKSQIEQYQFQIFNQLNQFKQNINAAKQATLNQRKLIDSLKVTSNHKAQQIEQENQEIAKLDSLLEAIELYQAETDTFFFQILQRPNIALDSNFESNFSNKINAAIFPLVREYYEDSLEEIAASELITQELTHQNIKIIRNYGGLVFALTVFLFLYIYLSIYLPIRDFKLAASRLEKNGLNYQPLSAKNPHDELGSAITYLNRTIQAFNQKVIARSLFENTINSINQSLIITNARYEIIKVNSQTLQLLGYSESELIGQPFERFLALINQFSFHELIEFQNFYTSHFSLNFLTKSQNQISLLTYFSPLFDSQDCRQGLICLSVPAVHHPPFELFNSPPFPLPKGNTY